MEQSQLEMKFFHTGYNEHCICRMCVIGSVLSVFGIATGKFDFEWGGMVGVGLGGGIIRIFCV